MSDVLLPAVTIIAALLHVTCGLTSIGVGFVTISLHSAKRAVATSCDLPVSLSVRLSSVSASSPVHIAKSFALTASHPFGAASL